MQAFYYVSRFHGLALINKEVLLLHVMRAGAAAVWGLDRFGRFKITYSVG